MAKTREIDHRHTIAENRAAEMVKKGHIKGERRSKRLRFRKFAESYLDISNPGTFLNIYKSAVKAGYSKTYSLSQAYKLLDNIGIQREIEAIRAAARENPDIATADEVLIVLTKQLRVLPNKLIDPATKQLIPLDEITDDIAQCLAGYEVTDRTVFTGKDDTPEHEKKTKYKLVDRQKAAEMLGRWHGIWEKDNRQKAPSVPAQLVAFPSGVMTLTEWQAQAKAILGKQGEAKGIPWNRP